MYDQRLDEGISRRTNRIVPLTRPKFTILNHSEVLSAKISRTSNAGSLEVGLKPVTLILQQALTRDIYENSYDAIFCATGYERRSWLRLLANSSLGKYFGLNSNAEDYTRLEVETGSQEPEDAVDSRGTSTYEVGDANDRSNSPDALPNSGSSTLASLDWTQDWPVERGGPTKKLYISRAYRLLPTGQGEKLQARIYVQGLAEETHGLSDTLLSVVGIRAGEVMDDLCTHFIPEVTREGPSARM